MGTFSILYNRIETQRNSTISSAAGDRTSEEKFYAARVSELFGFTEEGVKIPGFTFEDDAASHGAQLTQKFASEISLIDFQTGQF